MKFNLDKIPEILVPWDFSVTIDGKDYSTVRPSVGVIVALEGATLTTIGKLRDTLASLFLQPPDLQALEGEQLLAIALAYAGYFGEQISKNSRAVAAHVAAMRVRATASADHRSSPD